MLLTCSKSFKAWGLNSSSKNIDEIFTIKKKETNYEIYDINFIPSNKIFGFCDSTGNVSFYDFEGNSKGEILFKEPIYSTCFDLDGKYMAVGGDISVALWNLRSNQLVKILGRHKTRVNSVSFSINKTHIASASDDGVIMLHNIEKYKSYHLPVSEKFNMEDPICRIKFSPLQERMLAHCGDSGSVLIWDTARLDILKIYNSHSTTCNDIIFNPRDKNSLCSGGLDKKMVIYDLNSKRTVDIDVPEPITSLDFKKDGINIAVGSYNGSIFIYDLRKTKKPLYSKIGSHKKCINSIKWNPHEEIEPNMSISSLKIQSTNEREYETKNKKSTTDNILSPLKKTSTNDIVLTPENVQSKINKDSFNYIGSEKEQSIFSPVRQTSFNIDIETPNNNDSYFDDIDSNVSLSPFNPQKTQSLGITKETENLDTKSNIERVNKISSPLEISMKSGNLFSIEDTSPSSQINNDAIILLREEFNQSLQQMKEMMVSQIQNLHLEMLRQFQIQQIEIQNLLAENNTNRELLKEIKRLQEENQKLKSMLP